MGRVQITAFVIRLVALALLIHLFKANFDVGLYSDETRANFAHLREPSFRFVGFYLMYASRGFYFIAFFLKLFGSLLLLVFPSRFAGLLWAGIAPTPRTEAAPQP